MMLKQLLMFLMLTTLSIQVSKAQTFTLQDSTFEKGDVLIKKIYFDFGGGRLLPENKDFLDSLAHFMLMHPNLKIEIGYHTDHRGSDKSNLDLSKYRSNSIYKYLVEVGVKSKRLTAVGYGESRPIIPVELIEKIQAEPDKEEALAINRRTEFKIVELD